MQSTKDEIQYFQLEHYRLMINPACYLVTVRTKGDKITNSQNEIPKWIFRSKHAIWLTEEEKPIADRARRGDEIKNQLLAVLNLR